MYEKQYCPHCKSKNLIYLGDWDDDTNPTITAGQCWSCLKFFLIADDRELLWELMFQQLDLDNKERNKMVDALLKGEMITLENHKYDLSTFLGEYAISNKGEECK
jgi:hypothetical protein